MKDKISSVDNQHYLLCICDKCNCYYGITLNKSVTTSFKKVCDRFGNISYKRYSLDKDNLLNYDTENTALCNKCMGNQRSNGWAIEEILTG